MRRYIIITGLLSVGLGAALGLAACGGDSTPETPIVVTDSTQNLTQAEFITQADAICDQANTQIADIAAAGQGITRAADVANLRQGVITDIRALGTPVDEGGSASSPTDTSTVPTQDTSTFPSATGATGTDATSAGATSSGLGGTASDLEAFLTALAAEVKAGEKIDLASQRGEDTSAAEAELTAAKDKAATAATAYGFLTCGTDGTSSATSSSTSSSSSSSSAVPSAPTTVTPAAPSTGTSGGSSTSSTGTTGSGGGVSSGGGGVGPG
jgi:hypothetical protein